MLFSSFTVKRSGPPCTRDDLNLFEEFANTRLPEDYANFLLHYNGCVPSPQTDTFVPVGELPGGNEITVQQFFSLSDQCSSLRSLFNELESDVGFLPMTTIPIGEDSFGNVIGIDCETGLVNWTLCEERFTFDYLRNFELDVTMTKFIESLKAGPYEQPGR